MHAMFKKVKTRIRESRLSMRMKLLLSFGAVVVVLLMSIIISTLEYRRMSNYVSDMISANIDNIHTVQRLVDQTDTYNLEVLAVIGDDSLSAVPSFDKEAFRTGCETLRDSFGTGTVAAMADSVLYAYSAYMLASMELEEVYASSFIDTRDWYFTRLQPLFTRLRGYLDALGGEMYQELRVSSEQFDSGFYRSIIPGIVAVLAGILMLFILQFFLIAYYAGPLYKMRASLLAYLKYRHRYTYTFDGNDQLQDINSLITELADENRTLRRRISEMKEEEK